MKQAQATALHDWRHEAERIQVGKGLIYFRQNVGLPFDKRKLGRLENETIRHYGAFIRKFGREPKALFDICSLEIGYSKTYKLYLRLVNLRTKKVLNKKYKVNGAPVNWGSWRQFASGTDDSRARKEVFDDFIGKSAFLAPVVGARFAGFAQTMARLGTDPLKNYLAMEGIGYERLASFVKRLGTEAKSPFSESLGRYSREILGRDADYYDDFYFFRARVFRRYAGSFLPRVNPVQQIVKTMAEMGLDAKKVKVDDVDRKGKNASAFCFAIKVPTDVRISYRRSNPLENFTGIFHEMGHGVAYSSIDARAPYEDRYGVPMGVAEIFSTLFENLMCDREYLRHKLGLSEEEVADLIDRFRFNDLFFATFYAANSSMKLRYWKDGLSIDAASSLYSDLTEKYMGIRYPGEYWLLHHVMPDYPMYDPSYMLASVRAHELRDALVSKFGERYWGQREAGKVLLELMRPGRGIDLRSFSTLDPSPFVKYLKGAA